VIKNLYRKRLSRLSSDDSGFSLMEVIVAIAIMTVIATAAAALTGNGISTSATQERKQVAVTIANGALETVSGWSIATNSQTGVNNLYAGRGQAAVTAAFLANATRPGVAQTIPTWDTTLPVASTSDGSINTVFPDPNNPSAQPDTQNGTNYTVTTLIGGCYEAPAPANSTTPDNCVLLPSVGSAALIRVIVIVKWTAGATCAASGCYYQVSTILDPNADLEWITH